MQQQKVCTRQVEGSRCSRGSLGAGRAVGCAGLAYTVHAVLDKILDDSPGPYKDTGQHGSQGGINGVGCPLPPPFGSNPTHRLALIAE
eukprot:scaffold188918_cov30-Tisochrysis_lutea.AAC.1